MSNLEIDSRYELDTRNFGDNSKNLRVFPSIVDERSSTVCKASVRGGRSTRQLLSGVLLFCVTAKLALG